MGRAGIMAALHATILRKLGGTPLANATVAVLALFSLLLQPQATLELGTIAHQPEHTLFAQDRVVRINLTVADTEARSLRRHPREFVRATVQIGGVQCEQAAIRLKGSTGSFQPLDEKPC